MRSLKSLVLVTSIGVLLNIPFSLFAQNLPVKLSVDPGGFSIIRMPSDLKFPPLGSRSYVQTNYYTPKIADDSWEKIVVEDLRYSGGFRIQFIATPPTDTAGRGQMPVESLGILTFGRDGKPFYEEHRDKKGTPSVTAPLNGTPGKGSDYTLLTESHTDPGVSKGITLLEGAASTDHGHLGRWEVYPSFMIKVPAYVVPGTYVSTLTYTFMDETF